MPRYMLDTNMCIYLMKNQPEEIARRFATCYVGDVVMLRKRLQPAHLIAFDLTSQLH